MYIVRCAQSRAALATLLTRTEEDWKALAWVNGTSREIDCGAIGGRAGENIYQWVGG
jgi:hypothetical protein